MNKQRRNTIVKFLSTLEQLGEELQDITYAEQDAYDNMPQNLQDGERGQKSQEALDALDAAIAAIDEAKDSLGDAVNQD